MLMVAFPLATRLLLAKEFKNKGKNLSSTLNLFIYKPLGVIYAAAYKRTDNTLPST